MPPPRAVVYLATLYGAVDDGALPIALPRFVTKELEGYLDCGLLCRGFARLRCDGCEETRVVAFSCKGRGFCPSCLGRKMAATTAHLMEDVLPEGAPLTRLAARRSSSTSSAPRWRRSA